MRKAVEACQLLGETADGKQIYLYQSAQSSPVLREIGRLRELSFRAVGEGSGRRRDIDRFDSYYEQLILWDKDHSGNCRCVPFCQYPQNYRRARFNRVIYRIFI